MAGTSKPRCRLDYRRDIEGLRAIAILMVVAAHAKVPWLQGGFVGVDVFFVLSGYLITGLLVKEIERTGGVRMLEFYARRLRRLLPALLLVIAATCIAAMMLLAPFEQTSQAPAAAGASVWLSNLYFAFSSLDYFGPAAESNLFLHTWSLGVEEQFYLVWPALVLFFLGAWSWQGSQRDFAQLTQGMLATVAICLPICILLTYAAPPLAFYMVPARAWQFGLGALVLLSVRGRDARSPNADLRRWAIPAGWAGAALILGAGVLLDAQTPYPGAWALLPSLGASLVLFAGALQPQAGAAAMLSLAPLQALGRISYAWYLWHWPVLLLGATLVDNSDPLAVAGLVILSLLLALLSYHLVEAPIRRNPSLIARPAWSVAAGLVLMAGTSVASNTWSNAATGWTQQPSQLRYRQVRGDLPALYGMGCDEWFNSARVRTCYFGPQHATHTVVLMGDSVALQWFPAVSAVFQKPGWRVLVLTKSACPMADVPYFYERIGRRYTECEAWRKGALELLQSLRPDEVVLGSATSYPFTQAQWIEGTMQVLAAVRQSSNRVFVVQGSPSLPFDGPACLSRRDWRAGFLRWQDKCNASSRDLQAGRVRAWVAEAASHFDTVHALDFSDVICPDGRCHAERDGAIVFRDNQHLTASFVASLAGEMARRLGEPMAAAGATPVPGMTGPAGASGSRP